MATVIRAEISPNNKYYVDKHRYYELKHFCLQYNEWKKAYTSCADSAIFASNCEQTSSSNTPSDLTSKYAMRCTMYSDKIKLVEQAALEADVFLYHFILKGVTEGLSFTYLKTNMGIPCGRDMYYDRYRKFFWLLNQARN